ncbi:MAG: hypothetical protein CALGDGBN_01929 [Pseudomonadales bacterium]|nr:hypothetical protein [Pseudomonadales bacterium]
MAADEQQPCQRGPGPAEGDRIDRGVEAQLHLRAALRVEGDDIAAPGPGGGPQFAVRRERQVVDARVAEVTEGEGERIEDLDPVARGHIDLPTGRIDRQRLREALAVTANHREALGIELQQLAAAGGRPQPAVEVVGHVVDRLVEHDERVQCTTAELAVTVQRAAVRSAAHDHAAVGLHEDRQGPDACMALGNAGREHLGGERRQHLTELRGPRRGRGGNALLRLHEQHVRRRCLAGRRRDARVLRGAAHIGQRAEVYLRAVVGQRRDRDRALLVAGVVGGHRDELVAVPGLALEHRERLGALTQPDFPVAAVPGDVDRGVLDARSVGLLDRVPAHLVVRTADARQIQRGARRGDVEELHQFGRVERRRGIEDHARRGVDLAVLLEAERRGHGVADTAHALAAGDVRRQQSDGRIPHQFTGHRIDRLQQPGRRRGGGVDTGRDAQHVATRVAQIEVGLEVRAIGRHVDADVAELQVAEPEGARTESRVELRDDADFRWIRGRVGRVLEADRVRERALRRQELPLAVALRARDRGLGRALRRELEQLLQLQRRQFVGCRHRGIRAVGHVAVRRKYVERREIRLVRQPEIVILELRHRRNRDVVFAALVGFAKVPGGDLGELPRRIAIPLPDLREEGNQIPLALDLLPRRPDQHAAGQHRDHADHLRLGADRWCLVLGTQQAAVLECRQIRRDPGVLVGREVAQRHTRRGVGQYRLAQRARIGTLAGDELRARHRRGRRDHIEAEGCEQRHALVRDLLVGRGLQRLQYLDDRGDARRFLRGGIL